MTELSKHDRECLFRIWDEVWNRYEQGGWSSLTETEQTFYAAWHFEFEVNSGGFESYYFNSGGDHALDAPRALRRIGALQLEAVLEKANRMFPGGLPPRDIDERQERMGALGDDVDSLWQDQDEKVFGRTDPTEELLWTFYQNNRRDFDRT